MYARYDYVAGSTLANILADLGALLTGQTNKAALSVSCKKDTTEILATYDPAGWTMFDAAASATSFCLRAPAYDDPAQFKYMIIDGATAGELDVRIPELWNATTKVATNNTPFPVTTYRQRISLANGGSLYISASERRFIMLSYCNAAWGSSSNNTWSGVAERMRGDSPGDTLAAAYPLAVLLHPLGGLLGTGENCRSPRFRNPSNNSDTTSGSGSIICFNKSAGGTFGSSLNFSRIFIDGVQHAIVLPFSFTAWISTAFAGGKVSENSDIWLLAPNIGGYLDEITFNGKTYVLFLNSANNTAGSLLVPKG